MPTYMAIELWVVLFVMMPFQIVSPGERGRTAFFPTIEPLGFLISIPLVRGICIDMV
jgi:hypothetical protein